MRPCVVLFFMQMFFKCSKPLLVASLLMAGLTVADASTLRGLSSHRRRCPVGTTLLPQWATTEAAVVTTETTGTWQPDVPDGRCAAASSCRSCADLPECGWCPLERLCVEGDKRGPHSYQCSIYEFTHCTPVSCNFRTTCSECIVDPDCGWCGTTATCSEGSGIGPLSQSSCPVRLRWAHASSTLQCDTVGEPLPTGSLWEAVHTLEDKSEQRLQASSAALR